MEIVASIAVQAVLVGLSLFVTLLRCWIRLSIEGRGLTIPDYLVWAGWLCSLGWFICSVLALHLQIDHPLQGEELMTDSAEYLTTVFIACYFFDVGLYLPKASLTAFYWWLIPRGFPRLRVALYIATGYMGFACVASILVDTLIAGNISDNWSLENQMNSTWNSYTALAVNWALNWSTDIVLFALPFFIINSIKLSKRQRIALWGVFSLGTITIIISLARFVVYTATNYTVDDASGNLWCTAEMATAIIVVSLPSLKVLIVLSTTGNTSNRSNNGYINAYDDSRHHPFSGSGMSRSHVQAKQVSDDEIELVFQEAKATAAGTMRKPSLSPARSAGTADTAGGKGREFQDGVVVTTNVTVTMDVL